MNVKQASCASVIEELIRTLSPFKSKNFEKHERKCSVLLPSSRTTAFRSPVRSLRRNICAATRQVQVGRQRLSLKLHCGTQRFCQRRLSRTFGLRDVLRDLQSSLRAAAGSAAGTRASNALDGMAVSFLAPVAAGDREV